MKGRRLHLKTFHISVKRDYIYGEFSKVLKDFFN